MRGGIGTPEPGANDPTRGGGWFTDRYNASWHVAERVILPGRAFTRMCMCIHTHDWIICAVGLVANCPSLQRCNLLFLKIGYFLNVFGNISSLRQNLKISLFFDLRRGKKPGLP